MTDQPDAWDLFLSHATPDKPWVQTLFDELTNQFKLRVYLDERELPDAPRGFVAGLGAGIDRSPFLALILTTASHNRPWVVKEVSEHMAVHGPFSVLNVLLDDVPLPSLNRTPQVIDGKHRDAARVAAELARRLNLLRQQPDDNRDVLFQRDLAFTLTADAAAGMVLTDPNGRTHAVKPPNLAAPLRVFRRLSRQCGDDAARADLFAAARMLGGALFGLLFDGPRRDCWEAARVPGRERPTLRLLCDVDDWQAWPWELLHDGTAFLVREGQLDVVRSTPQRTETPLVAALEPFRLVVNVSAPRGSGSLRYEEESYRLTRALSERCPMTPTELGTLDDLVETVRDYAPLGIHFSGHGGPGVLVFEDAYGDAEKVPVGRLLEELRRVAKERLPSFFYLACCHGNDPAEVGEQSAAGLLHRSGMPHVLAYQGPVGDTLSTRAEETVYAALAAGETVAHAVRLARNALLAAPGDSERPTRPATAAVPASVADPSPFAWSQLVFYRSGRDLPLSPKPEPRRSAPVPLHPQREFHDPVTKRRLKTGFIGRRTDLHRLRRRVREDGVPQNRVFVLQGLGGLGKSTLSFRMPALLGAGEAEWATLWCQDTEKHTDPAAELVQQLAGVAQRFFGQERWLPMLLGIDREAQGEVRRRAEGILNVLVGSLPRLVLVLDNLESLLVGPAVVAGDFAAWRTEALRQLWLLLRAYAENTERLTLVASCRYVNDDLADVVHPVSPLPPDAMYRLLSWLPALQTLSAASRDRLAHCLAGHPRAAEFASVLVAEQRRRAGRGEGDEWDRLVAPALPKVDEKLSADLLLKEIWDNVLDEAARRMLFRMTLLRRRWDDKLALLLGEADTAAATLERLRRTSLVECEEDREGAVTYALHPATAEFVRARSEPYESLRHETHLRVGEHLEREAATSPWIETGIEAGHHLFEAGEYDRAYELLGISSDRLQQWGQVTAGLGLLEPFLEETVRARLSADRRGGLLGTVGNAYADLGQAKKAIEFHLQWLEIARAIKDRRNEGRALGNLGAAYADLGQAEKAIEFYLQHLEIARAIKDRRGEANASWNLGLALKKLDRLAEAIPLMEVGVRFLQDIGHPDADKHAGRVAALRQRLAGGS